MDAFAWVIASLSTFVGVILASGSGTGGGALYMPAFLILFQDAHRAVPFAKVTIFGLSVSSLFLNINKRHPRSNRPLINFEISALLEPPTLMGAVLGVFLNLLLPSSVLIVLLIVVLSITVGKTFATGLRQFKEEREIGDRMDSGQHLSGTVRLLAQSAFDDLESPRMDGEETFSLLPGQSDMSSSGPALDSPSPETPAGKGFANRERLSTAEGKSRTLAGAEWPVASAARHRRSSSTLPIVHLAVETLSIIEEDSHTDWSAMAFLIVVWATNFVVLGLAGGPHAIICGNWWQQSLIGSLLGILMFLTVGYAVYLHRFKSHRDLLGIVEPSIEFGGYSWVTLRGLTLYPLVSLIAGVCAGALGIGGGLIKGPLLIAIGLEPLSAVTSALYMIVFTSATTTFSFGLSGRIELLPSIWFFSLAAVAAVIGIWAINWIVTHYHHSSIVTLFLAGVIFISMCCMVFSMIYDEHFGTRPKQLTLEDACKFLHHHGLEQSLKHHHLLQTHVMIE